MNILSQNDGNLHSANFKERGFIFSPFENEEIKESVFIRRDNFYEISFEHIISEETEPCLLRTDNSTTTLKSEHIENINKAIEQIKKGHLTKVVLSRIEVIDRESFSIINTFKKLLVNYTNAFVYLWYHPKIGLWMGASPELLLNIKDKIITTASIAGTTKAVGDEVVWSDKEIDEQKIVTSYIENILSINKINDIRILPLENARIGNISHIKNVITGVLDDNSTLEKLLSNLHPTPAVCGVSKDKSIHFILKNERHKRSFYSGFLGEINILDRANIFVNLRCMEICHNDLILYAGGGIIIHSIPEDEWLETENKLDITKDMMVFYDEK
ncbi:chorismate-binding protein [Ichthyobacterium seriolicida]|uniref:Isochorismate synthase n=1 Tax=Ichthyobacterium seriolicida TaxID=242600 RepID=A0A1J1E2Z2_9FLAO|nr:chorismate-binding protein [Ichthyobacterium seriolicida]BAV94396.1 isochorismate synthase [Ichthyobacterium seriolicida]